MQTTVRSHAHSIPPCSAPFIRYLDLRGNRLRALPNSLCLHPQLRTLLLGDNELASLPTALGHGRSKLAQLNLAGNPLCFPPEEVVEEVRSPSYVTICH